MTMKTIEMSKIFYMNVITPFKTKILTKFSVYISFSSDLTAVTSIYYYYCVSTVKSTLEGAITKRAIIPEVGMV